MIDQRVNEILLRIETVGCTAQITADEAMVLMSKDAEMIAPVVDVPVQIYESRSMFGDESLVLFGGTVNGASRIKAWHNSVSKALKNGGIPVLCRCKGDKEAGYRYWAGRVVSNTKDR